MDPDNSTAEDGNPKDKNRAIDARGLSGKPGTVKMIYICYNSYRGCMSSFGRM